MRVPPHAPAGRSPRIEAAWYLVTEASCLDGRGDLAEANFIHKTGRGAQIVKTTGTPIRLRRVSGAARSLIGLQLAASLFVGLSATTATAHAASAPPQASVSVDQSGSRVMLGTVEAHRTTARVANLRTNAFTSGTLLTWDETSATSSGSKWAWVRAGQSSGIVARDADPVIHLKSRRFDPLAPGARVVEPGAPGRLAIVQFRAAPIAELQAALAADGARVIAYLPRTAVLVEVDPARRAGIAAKPFVRWVGDYTLGDKLLAEAAAMAQPARVKLQVSRRGLVEQQRVADAVAAVGGRVDSLTPGQFWIDATLSPQQMRQFAARDEIVTADVVDTTLGTDMLVIRQLMGAIPLMDSNQIQGQGIRGEITDAEFLQPMHAAFLTTPPLVRFNDLGAGQSHGTQCFGIIFANWPSNPVFNGLAFAADQGIFLHARLMTTFGGTVSRLTLNQQAIDPAGPIRSMFQSASVGTATNYDYSSASAEFDDTLFQADYLTFQSQSNTATTFSRPQAWAKNVMSVGGISWRGTQDRSDDEWTSASFGPAPDGRVKPDVANTFEIVPTTSNATPTSTLNFSGTSAATPVTAGVGALFMQLWHQGAFRLAGGGTSGGAATPFDSRPFSTTVKAMIINRAFRYPLDQGGLSRARQGWGMPNAGSIYDAQSDSIIVNADDPLTTSQSRTYTVTVAASAPELRASLVYIEPAALPSAAFDLVNDLDLKVTSPSGAIYWGNVGLMSSNFSVAGGAPQSIDNVENVFIDSPEPGTWTVEVVAAAVVQDAYVSTPAIDAAFSLVVSGLAIPPVVCYANCDGSSGGNVLTPADFSCFLAKYRTGDPYANCDGSSGTPGLSPADFSCFLAKYRAGCPSP